MEYETREMSRSDALRFIEAFDLAIGTDRELNEIDGLYYVVCFELEGDEVQDCIDIENYDEEYA